MGGEDADDAFERTEEPKADDADKEDEKADVVEDEKAEFESKEEEEHKHDGAPRSNFQATDQNQMVLASPDRPPPSIAPDYKKVTADAKEKMHAELDNFTVEGMDTTGGSRMDGNMEKMESKWDMRKDPKTKTVIVGERRTEQREKRPNKLDQVKTDGIENIIEKKKEAMDVG